MTRTALRQLRRTLATLDVPATFVYCVEAADGLPALLVSRRVDAAAVLQLQQTARIPTFVRGLVAREGDQLTFAVTHGAAALLEDDLVVSFLEQLPLDADVQVQAAGE